MQTIKIQEEQLRTIIREEMSDIIKKEFMKLRLMLIPEISAQEQKEIEELYGQPTNENWQEQMNIKPKLLVPPDEAFAPMDDIWEDYL
jgi:hypothetical protein